ncbi:roquin-1-like isoform X5 [Acipenser ruthenus]|uniref:roquin-1-like isoform X5 n=1 Tax=Acipenser ruthenus TaxID=7906 RepID=UPI0027413C89|nr:roquin-1-like isoform X5 [Acipenser ruthenus]
MPVQAPQWTEFLLCPICTQTFEETIRKPISLGCGHTVCKMCLNKLHRKACPFDQTTINTDIEQLPVNSALLQLVGGQIPKQQPITLFTGVEDTKHYDEARKCVEELALYLKPLSSTRGVGLNSTTQSALSRPMQRKLVTLVHCQLVEEEGRIRAMRAARSLGERTVTELILQHQNPQQLSSNLWAAVRARGCQFLGPAMQEEALKLVLLALEDGSPLSRKVLVLFVVQRLEPRFPQASKTSIGHVVQLLYRASCFKVTKRDEDSSLMQLKEEFRTYEALRREHDSQIVQIAMEGGLRIAPDQWSSLLYGDQSHKSHMQSIIDKLQTPASFAQSVQELTIALQRTGDPANLNRLRPHLELLANIDPCPDAPPPMWEQLEKGLVAVKTVVHGLVDFIQNHSKKGTDQQQPSQHSKYKTYMCRDMKQKGGCPRGSSCTFAHSQEELEKLDSVSKGSMPVMPINAHPMPHPRMPTEHPSKQLQMVSRGSQMYTQQPSDMYYQDPRPPASAAPYEHPPYPAGVPYPYPSSQYVQPRYTRTAPSEPGMQFPDHYPYIQDRQYPGPPMQYPPMAQPVYPAHCDVRRTYGPPQSFQREEMVRMNPGPVEVLPPASGSPYLSESRERYPPEGYPPEGYPASPHPSQMRSYHRESYSRMTAPHPSLDYLHRRRKEIMAQLEERKVISPPPFAPSPTLPRPFPTDFPQEYLEDNPKAVGKYKENEYSPWSCDTIGSYIGTKDVKPKDIMASEAMELMNIESKGLRNQPVDMQRRSAEAKDDDPIIPFGTLPTVSRFGVISRTSKTGYQTTFPVQAMASSQGAAPKHSSASAEFSPYTHGGWGAAPYHQHQNMTTQGRFSDRMPMPPDREQLKIELQQLNQQINQQTQIRGMEAASNTLLLQREVSALATQPPPTKWAAEPISSEQLSMELHQVEREIGKRTREIAMESQAPHDQYKMKPAENGQPEHKVHMEDLSLALRYVRTAEQHKPCPNIGEGANGSSLVQDSSMNSLSSKTSSLSLSADSTSSSELQVNGVGHSSS